MYKTAFNPSDTAVAVSDDGRVIGGHEWGTVDTTDPVGARLLDAGALILVDAPGDDADTSKVAAAAFERTDEITARAGQARELNKDLLHETAVDAGLVDEDDSVRKNELVGAVAEATDVEVPAPAKKSTTRRKSQEA